jgi:hypothetical protein
MQIEPCTDRTGLGGTRAIANEATQSLREKVLASGLFVISQDARLMLTCDVEHFAEGSALKRWIMPGWGTTKAKLTVMIWDQARNTVLGSLSSVSVVDSGGLYTIGADQYILGVAISNIVDQLSAWRQGKNIR